MNNTELDAARNFLATCKELYPETDLMDDAVKATYLRSINIIRQAELEQKRQEYRAKTKKKPRQKGKLQQFEEDVLECLRQGWGEERQLLEEAENRRNQWARKNYIRAYYRAVARFNRGRE